MLTNYRAECGWCDKRSSPMATLEHVERALIDTSPSTIPGASRGCARRFRQGGSLWSGESRRGARSRCSSPAFGRDCLVCTTGGDGRKGSLRVESAA
jgi:hypothetical protein